MGYNRYAQMRWRFTATTRAAAKHVMGTYVQVRTATRGSLVRVEHPRGVSSELRKQMFYYVSSEPARQLPK